jgi:hypothetical protein
MAMAYDVPSGKIVLFGGLGAGVTYLDETWTFDGVTWTRLSPPLSPPARTAAGMTFDAALQKLVLFGGFNGYTGYCNDTWIFDAAQGTWEQAITSQSPPAATEPSVFTDPLNGRADVFGGYSDPGGYWQATWQFNGTDWIDLHPSPSPAARAGAILAFDHSTKDAVLFGGQSAGGSDTTWTWDGKHWTQQSPATQPPIMGYGAGAFDPRSGLLITFGGQGETGPLNTTWAWTGSDWTQLYPASSPAPRRYTAMANDEALGGLVLFGGGGGMLFNDTWELISADR